MTQVTRKRRIFLKSTLATSLVGIAAGSGLLKSTETLAEWPARLFDAKDIKSASGDDEGTTSTDIIIKAPDIAENGAVVPVTVETSLPNVESISIFVKGNLHPLSAVFILGPGVQPNISTRIKLTRTSEIVTVIKSGDKRFTTAREVKVASGSCTG